MKKTVFILFVWIGIGLSFFSCKSSKKEGKTYNLINQGWILKSALSAEGVGELVPDSASKMPTLLLSSTDNGATVHVSGNSGCNNFVGKADLEGNKIKLGQLGSTRMFCDKNMNLENAILTDLGKVDNYKITKGYLYLSQGDKVLMTYLPAK